jgi:carnitine 3-dehydrogenase
MTQSDTPLKRLSTPLEGTPARVWDASATVAAPLNLHNPHVLAEWVDYNGHMSESCYLLVFGDNSDAFFRYVGIDETYRDLHGFSFYTVETHIHNLKEVAEGAPMKLDLQLLDADDKRMHIFHSLTHAETGDLLATGEQMLVHVDMAQGRSATMPPWLHERVHAVKAAHAALARPRQAGSSIGIRRKT